MQYVGKLMRDVDPAPIRAAIERWESVPQAEKARFAALERWRDRLLDDATALDAFVAEHPRRDRDALVRAVERGARRARGRRHRRGRSASSSGCCAAPSATTAAPGDSRR